MPVFTHVFEEHNLLVSQFCGPITDELVIGYYEHLLSFADSALLFVELVDFRDAGDVHISRETLPTVARMIADAYMPIDTRIQSAVVAPSDLGFGMVRMYELAEAPEMIDLRVFRDVDQALIWLGLDAVDVAHLIRELSPESPSVLLRFDV